MAHPSPTLPPRAFEIRLGDHVTQHAGRADAIEAARALSLRRRGRDVRVLRADGVIEMTYRSGALHTYVRKASR